MLESILGFILEHIISLIIAGIGTYVSVKIVPLLKELCIFPIVRILVKGAEKLAETSQIEKGNKKDYVIVALEGAGIKVTPLVDGMIEAAVKELDEQVDKITDQILDE